MLKCIKEDVEIEGKWLWQEDQNEKTLDIFNVPKKTYLMFGIFVLDIFVRDVDTILESCYNTLMDRLNAWNKFYPWSEYNGVSVRFDFFQSRRYILGQLCVEDNLEQEESLIVTLLRIFSKEVGEQVFIKISDTDGDFLLANCHECMPGNYEYPLGNNRLWLHNGKFIIIPDTIHPDRGISPQECIDTMLHSPFKCVQLTNISKKLDTLYPVEDFPNKQLSELGVLTLELSNTQTSEIIKANPKLLNFLIKSLFSSEISTENITDYPMKSENETETHQFLVSKNHFDLLLLYLQVNNIKDDLRKIPKYSGKLLANCLDTLLKSKYILLSEERISELDQWTSWSLFKEYNFPVLDYSKTYEPEKREEPNEKLMDLFSQFFEENQENSAEEKITSSKADIEEYRSSDDEEERKAKEYLSKENSGINEDDFFEFFLKEALNLQDTDIEELRRDVSEPKISETQDSNLEKDPSDDDIDEIDDMFDELRSKDNVSKAFKEMFESLNIDGAPNGPFESFLRNLTSNSDS